MAGDERVVEVEGKGIWGEPRGKWGDGGEHGSEWGTGERTEALFIFQSIGTARVLDAVARRIHKIE